MNYQIIVNRERLIDFLDWLPDLEDNEKYFIALFARKKYAPELKSNYRSLLYRAPTSKEHLLEKIEQLEVPFGVYKVPQHALALYINPNPRHMKKATVKLGKKLWDLHETGNNFNIHQEALSAIQSTKSRSLFKLFDIDKLEHGFLEKLHKILKPYGINYYVLRTRGGYHIIVKKGPESGFPNEKWYQDILKNLELDQDTSKDHMIPIPGTFQGDFCPYFIW